MAAGRAKRPENGRIRAGRYEYMTDKELRKLRRDDLLQILISQQKQIDALNEQLEQSKAALADRDMAIKESGTLAEAALKMNGVFESAQSAADEYVRQMQKRVDELVAEAERRESAAQRTAENLVSNARMEAERIVSRAKNEAVSLGRQDQGTPAPQDGQADGSAAVDDDGDGKRRRWHLWGNKGS